MKRAILFLFLLGISMQLMATKPPAIKKQKTLTIFFDHFVGNKPLQLEEETTNIFGENITIQRFRYYVSNFSVIDDQGNKIILPVQYFLVDEADPESKKIELQVPDIAVKSIQFILGVDSIKNVSGIQTGALDPAKGMFWTWNSGYVMAKLEGTAPSSTAAGHRFTFHVGGFRTDINVIKNISLDIDAPQRSSSAIHIAVDINHWFKGNSDLKISETPVCHSPGNLALRIANNYMSMFSIKSFTK